MNYEEQLSLPKKARRRPRPVTESISFDETRVLAYDVPTAVSNLHRYGPTVILEIPEGVSKTVIQRLGVHANPDGFFREFCWWFLSIDQGPTQELLVEGRITAGGALAWGGSQAQVGGIWRSPYGSLAEPEPVSIQLHQAAQLYITIWSSWGGLHPLTVYTRVVGVTQTKLPGA